MAKKLILVLLTLVCLFTLVSCLGCEHEWSEATCEAPSTCSKCGETNGNAKGHSFSEWTEITAATCTTNGSKTRSCACGKTETEVIPAAHDLVEHQAKAATCTEAGNEAYVTCKNCTYTTYVEISAKEHELENHAAEPSTCTKAGHNAYQSCNNCSYSTYEALPLEKHDKIFHPGKPATCTSIGYKAYEECKNCPYTTYEEIKKEEHDIISHNAKPKTCTEDGHEAYEECTKCDYTTYVKIPASHDIVSHNAKPKTCIEDGHEAYEECTKCDYTTYVKIPASHDIVSHNGKPASCTETGYKPYETCNNCNYSTYKEIPMEKHDYTATVTPPTCEGIGYTTYQCKNCPHSYVADEVKATGHSWGAFFVSQPITKVSDGEMRSNCLNCSKHQTRAPKVERTGIFGYADGNKYSENATYTIYEDGTLKVVGTGKIFDAGWNGAYQPYNDIRSFIKRIIICEGITAMQGGTFAYLPNLEYVELPNSLSRFENNVFMDSFKSTITSFTFPANVTFIGSCAIGQYNSNNALFTDVYILNPNVEFKDKVGDKYRVINAARDNSKLTLYSYGKDNKVSQYAATFGFKYVDLNDMLVGTVDNLKYTYSNGVLTLEAVDNSKPAVLPTEKPWAEKNADITKIDVGSGIADIPASYFADCTALKSVTLSEDVRTIGSKAFSTSSACNTAMTINIPEKITSIASDILSGRTNVTVSGFRGTAAENIKQDGVTLKLKTSFKLLLLGNSLSLDAADATGANTPSKLYEILKSMLGEDTYVQIGVLYQGAKTAGWHATVAERDLPSYQFYVISDDTNGLWQIKPGYSSREGLLYSDWDIVTIQPYGTEVHSGVGSMTGDTDAKQQNPTVNDPNKDEKFKALKDSLPFLLDHIDKYCPDAKIYYYLTWANTQNTDVLNHMTTTYNNMLDVALTAMQYVGTESGKGFEALLPVGTAIQNARSTYFAFFNVQETPNKDNQIGLLRDSVHLSYRVGRYIAALSFAELLVPESYRVDGYVLPDVADSPIVGKLPKQYTEIARKCVQNMLDTYNLTGDGRYGVKKLEGYEVDPTTAFKAEVEAMNLGTVTAANANAFLTAVQNKILANAPADMSVTVTSENTITLTSNPTSVTVTVTLKYGYRTVTFTKTVSAALS